MREELLIRFLRGECSKVEEHQIHQWLDTPAGRNQLEELMEKKWEEKSGDIGDETDYNGLLKKIHSRVLVPTGSKRRRLEKNIALKSLKLAASLFLVFFSGYFLSLSWVKRGHEPQDMLVSTPVKYFERVTGAGEKLTLSMPDGSRIILNSESVLWFDSEYGLIDRTIRLNGEAFFEVVSDSNKPFKVDTDGLTTYALGTSFNISTRHSSYKVALTEGKVAVVADKETVNLDPGQMAVWKPDHQRNEIKISYFDAEKITSWKDGRLAFDKKKLHLIFKDLETWYGVRILLDPNLNGNQLVSGTFENKNLKDILTGLAFSMSFSFELNGNQVIIKK
ncbi:putative anti-sigma factor [Lunatimonas lonarensis]|uniref:Putative anti-sigma factor n=1 Tax=Lunatimonas lonarensis TaxID=1232681 RepID=R7ZV02_9BACT|nr:FecR domain-containing protein [Lunatimonas lonarensis]EON77970.1 putative anti-sigma factor [Lunatimonas lonarensis]